MRNTRNTRNTIKGECCMDDLLTNIGMTLRKTRTERRLTLEEASALTGVSKAMLGQIERGESTPTISTLWKISTGLKLPFSEFLSARREDSRVIHLDELEPVYESEGRMILHNVFPFDPMTGFELFHIRLLPGAHHVSESHKASTQEYVVVTEGALEILLNGSRHILEAPAAMSFQADIPHEYANPFETDAVFQNIVKY